MQLPSFPSFTREVPIAAYLVHRSDDPEDYFFLFEFGEFVERSKAGFLVRPKLQVIAGRQDFNRATFARHMREAFGREFEGMRAALGNPAKGSWFSLEWLELLKSPTALVSSVMANTVLLVATTAGKSLLPAWMKGRSKEVRLEDEISGLKSRIDTALAEMSITIHPDLQLRCHRLGGVFPYVEDTEENWPLPPYVAEHLDAGEGGAWW